MAHAFEQKLQILQNFLSFLIISVLVCGRTNDLACGSA